VEIRSVIVNVTGGKLGSEQFEATLPLKGTPVGNADVKRVLDQASSHALRSGRAVLHALPTGFALDTQKGVLDPSGMIGNRLGVDLHVVSGDASAARNVMLAVERCHLTVEAVVASPYAAGLATLVDDEAEMGAVVIDMGAGCTSAGVFSQGHLVHVDAFAVGGHHVTMDLARGLSTRLSTAERLKILYGSATASAGDERDLIAIPSVDDDDRDIQNHVPRSHLVRMIRPRIEEILELARDRLSKSGFSAQAGRRVILTGGASQLTGMSDIAKRVLQGQVRIGRPLGVKGLPEAAKGPAFAASIGLLVYPQVAHLEHTEIRATHMQIQAESNNYLSRMGRWLKESF
jgi:cell division protein FtsA